MQKPSLIIFFALIFSLNTQSQSCLPNGITFSTQAEIANFPNNYPGCTVIEGPVTIAGANINNVNGLSAVTSVGSLQINGYPNLTSLNGLSNLTTVVGDFAVANCSKLLNLNGLNNLTAIGGNFLIENNPVMTSLDGLQNITSLSGGVGIISNAALENLNGLNHLKTITGGLNISNNNALADLQGLDSVQTIGGGLNIGGNYALQTISHLTSLTAVGGDLGISYNQVLHNLDGLENLATVGITVGIYHNPALTNVAGLQHLRTIGGSLGFQFNDALVSLQGLERIKKVFSLFVNDCPALTSLSSLDSLETIEETLQIYKNNSMTTLNGLKRLKSVGQIFLLEGNHALTKLNGLNNLDSIGGFFSFVGSEVLTDFDELKNLRVINGSLYFSGSDLLTNLNGFEKLHTIGYDFIFHAPGLTNFQGMGSLRRVGQRFILEQNNALKNLEGLHKLQVVGSNVQIVANPVLHDLTGLDSLQTVGGNFTIYQNPLLKNLEGPGNLKQVGGQLQILQNPNLSECAVGWLCNLLVLGAVNPQISENDPGCDNILFECAGIPIRASVLIDAGGDCVQDSAATALPGVQVVLTGNLQQRQRETHADGVARFGYSDFWTFHLSLPQFPAKNWAVCQDTLFFDQPNTLDTIRATFLLAPLNQCPELSLNLGLPSSFRSCFVQSPVQVSIQNRGTVLAEDVVAAVVMPPVFELVNSVPPIIFQSGDTLFFDLNDLNPFEITEVRLTVKTRCDTFLLGQTLCWEAFANVGNPCPPNLPQGSDISLLAECLGDTTVRFILKNVGEQPTQGLHEYRILRNAEVFNTATFSLDAHESKTIDLTADGATYRMEAITSTDPGVSGLTARSIENCGGLTPGLITAFWMDKRRLEQDFDCREVVGSFDPNQKTAIPTGAGAANTMEANRPIRYTIDFQNTGTDTAFRVLLRDVLPENLDVTTFRPGASSHPYTWEIRQQHTLEVLFYPIMLPDSNVNEAASHGFFSFEISQKPDLPDGSILENTAAIIFDFNPPIVTNTVRHTIGQLTVRVDEAQPYANLWALWGNPLRDAATFRAETFLPGEKRFDLYEAGGRLVSTAWFSSQEFEFRRDRLAGGLYFFKISDAQGRVFAGKIIVAK